MIGWGGEDVPGHPVPINKEGNACMHMQRDNEGIRLPKLLGLAVAGATLLAGMVVLPATQASAANDDYGYKTEDDFIPGEMTSEQPTLTVTKFLSLSGGLNPTGSANDLDQLKENHDLLPAKDILFNVQEVTHADGMSLADIKPGDSSTYKTLGTQYAGVTDGQGVISTWYEADTTAANLGKIANAKENGQPSETSKVKAFQPAKDGVGHYYIMTENTDKSWAFASKNPNKLDSSKYTPAAPSFFGLPYATQALTGTKRTGYIYHLHLYPKNVNSTVFSKTVQNVYDSKGGVKSQRTAVAGDKIDYKLTQKIYADSAPATGDGKLDVTELAGNFEDIKISDRMSTALKVDDNGFNVAVHYKDGTGNQVDTVLTKDTDYKLDNVKNPDRLVGTGKMFTTSDSNSNYYNFTFFSTAFAKTLRDSAKADIHVDVTYSATVTPDGDSTATNGVANDAASDYRENKGAPTSEHTNVLNAVFVFGSIKSKDKDYAALPGTVYRLIQDQDHPDSYLGTDGKFYTEAAAEKAGVQLYKATANEQGVVAFAGLPIFGSAASAQAEGSDVKTVQDVHWVLEETSTPSGWRKPISPFTEVTYSNVKGQTEDQLAQTYGTNGAIEPAYGSLNFGQFNVTPAEHNTKQDPLKYNNVDVQKYLMHYEEGAADAPLSLPLTGGRGIVLLLVVGALLMGGALYARSRRNNAARA